MNLVNAPAPSTFAAWFYGRAPIIFEVCFT